MRHATTNYWAIKKLIDSGDKSVRTACYQEWDGGFAYYLYKDRDRFLLRQHNTHTTSVFTMIY